MTLPPRQLALALPHDERLTREDFLEAPSNAAALGLVERWPDWPNRVMAIAGPAAIGKTHLAAIWAERSGARTVTARALAGGDVPLMLATGAVVVEDVEPGRFDETSLFHLLNLARELDAFVLITAQHWPPADGPLPDLQSRLRAVPSITLDPPDDALLRAILVKLCADRQVAVDEGVISYLVARIERSIGAARRIVARLDDEALRQGRAVTRALAAEVLRPPGA